MIESSLDINKSILYVRPKSALSAKDFLQLAKTVDPFIESIGALAGLIIETPSFPGWDSLAGMVAHFRFVHDHHKKIKRIALVTDSSVAGIAERFAPHFIAAEIKHFASGDVQAAEQWVSSGN
ncbi:MAG TPA: STAS/SEC14 domain-containing protein [Gemmatales bacterium]|nr:STAS/SEC14 domain-containing protein [Gemmatales bacterium]